MGIKAANSPKNLPEIETSEEGACGQVATIKEVVDEYELDDTKTETETSNYAFENSYDESEESLDDVEISKNLPDKRGIDVDVSVNDIVPDVYEKFGKVKKLTPKNPFEYVPYQRDQELAAKRREKENIEPIEEIPSHRSFYDMTSGHQGMTNWGGGYGVNRAPFPGQLPHYYRLVPPPLPSNLSNPPPLMWQAQNSHHRLPMPPPFAPINLPPSQFYAAQAQNQHQMKYYGNNIQGYPPNTAHNFPQHPYPDYNKYYHHQQQQQHGTGQELQPIYKQNYPNNTNNIGAFCQNLIEKYLDVTGQRVQQLYQENNQLKMLNDQLRQQTPQKPKPVVSFYVFFSI